MPSPCTALTRSHPKTLATLLKLGLISNLNVSPSHSAFRSLLLHFTSGGDMSRAVELVEVITGENAAYPFDNFLCSAVISGFSNTGTPALALMYYHKTVNLHHRFRPDLFTYTAVLDAFYREGRFGEGHALVGKMLKEGLALDVVAYNTMIHGLCKAGKMCEADEISRRFPGNNFTYSTLLHGYMKGKDAAGVRETKNRLEAAGISFDVDTCNVLIKAMFVVGIVDDASTLFKEMPQRGMVPDSVTYCTMIDGYLKAGMIDEALKVYNQYSRSSSLPSTLCHDHIIRGLCENDSVERGVEVFLELIESDILIRYSTCRMLIRAQFKVGKRDGVLKLIYRIEKLKPDFLPLICNDAIVFLHIKGCVEAALDVYMLLKRRGLDVAGKSYYFLAKGLIHSGSRQIFQLLLGDYVKTVGISDPRMIKMSSLYLCQKNVEETVRFLRGMNKENISIGVLTAVLDRLKKAGRVEDAHNLLMKSEQNGVPVDAVVYGIIVDGLCKDGCLEKALDLCATMSKKGINPDIVIYNSVIHSLCQQGCLVEAFRLFDSLEQINLLPDVVTYATLIGDLSRDGFLQDAKMFFKRMVLNGITPNTCIYNFLINGYCTFGLVDEALKLLSDMEGRCLQPDAFTISAVIGGYCRKGNIESAQVFYGEYRSRGFSPDFLGFLNLIKGLVAKGRMEETRTTVRHMLQSAEVMDLINKAGDGLHIESLVSLLAAACDQGRIQEIIDVLSEVGFISFSSWRSNGGYSLGRLIELHTTGTLDADIEKKSFGKVVMYPSMGEIPGNEFENLNGQPMTSDIVGILHKKEENHIENYESLMGKSLNHDFNTYYSIISTLCSKGDLQKANDIVKRMILNIGGNS